LMNSELTIVSPH